MEGCVYPYRHIAARRPSIRSIASGWASRRDAVVIGAFVSALKLSRRCLALWREVLERVPRAKLALLAGQSRARARCICARRRRGRIAADRVAVPAAGPRRSGKPGALRARRLRARSDALTAASTARWRRSTWACRSSRCVGQRHGERTSYSILTKLSASPRPLRKSGPRDMSRSPCAWPTILAFMASVRAAIREHLAGFAAHRHGRHTRGTSNPPTSRRYRAVPRGASAAAFRRCLTKPLQSRKPLRTQPRRIRHCTFDWRRRRKMQACRRGHRQPAQRHRVAARICRSACVSWPLACRTRATSKRHSEPAASGHAQARLRACLEQPRLGAAQSGAARRARRRDPEGARAAARLRVWPCDAGAPRARPRATTQAAEASLRAALRLRPDLRSAMVGLARLVAGARAASTSRAAVRLARSSSARRRPNGFSWEACSVRAGRAVPARDAFARVLRGGPSKPSRGARAPSDAPDAVRLGGASCERAPHAPTVSDGAREALIESCTRDRSPSEVTRVVAVEQFLLPYQGQDDKALRQRYAALIARSIDIAAPIWRPLPRTVVGGRRIRIGFASAFFKIGTVRHVFPALDHRARSIAIRDLRLSPASGHRRRGQRDRRQRRSVPPSRRSALARGRNVARSDSATTRSTSSSYLGAPECIRCHLRSPRCSSRPVSAPRGGIRRRPVIRRSTITCRPAARGAAGRRRALRRTADPAAGDRHAVRAAGDSTPDAPTARASSLPQGRVLLLCPQSLFKCTRTTTTCWRRPSRPHVTRRCVLFEGRHPALTDRFMRRLERAFMRAASRSASARSCCRASRTLIICASTASAMRCSIRCTGRVATRASTRSPAGCLSSRCPVR